MPVLEAVVLGVAATDLIAQVESLPRPDEIVLANEVNVRPGGAGANVAVGLARLGHAVGFVGKLGDDENGRRLLHAFQEEGVDTRAVIIEKQTSSATCFIAVNPQGERMIVALGGAGTIDRTEELDPAYIQQAEVLFISDVDGAIATKAATTAHEAGATVFYSPGGIVAARGLSNLQPLLGDVDVLLISRTEAQKLVPGTTPEVSAQELVRAGPDRVVQTLGAKGALIAGGDDVVRVSAFPVDSVVDTTGAGDAFAAGLIAARLEGRSWSDAVTMGCAVAALKLGRLGARNGLPGQAEVAVFLRQQLGRGWSGQASRRLA